jgi:hypothetical protein
MIKLILLLLWWPHKLQDSEFNLEAIDVFAVERTNTRESLICYKRAVDGVSVNYRLPCTLAKHDQLVARFRKKLGLV